MRRSAQGPWRLLALPLLAAGCLAGQAVAQPGLPPPPRGVPVAPPPAQPGSRPTQISVRAWVNGKPIFDQELLSDAAVDLLQQLRPLPEPQRSVRRKEILSAHLQSMIEQELIVQDAEHKLKGNPQAYDKLNDIAEKEFDKSLLKQKRRMGGEEHFQVWLGVQGLTVDTYRKKWKRMFLANQYLYSRIGPMQDAIGQPEMLEYYQQHMNEFQTVDRVEWQDLFVAVGPRHPGLADAHHFAEQLADRLRQGEDFANLLAYDDGLGRTSRGVGIGQRRGEIRPPEVEGYIWNMRDGEVGPPLDLSTGVHVFRLVKRYYAGQMPYDEKVQAQIREKLKSEVWERERKRVLRELTEHAVLQVARHPLP